jgi:hypothetical protein
MGQYVFHTSNQKTVLFLTFKLTYAVGEARSGLSCQPDRAGHDSLIGLDMPAQSGWIFFIF